jgi:hypothetical protein
MRTHVEFAHPKLVACKKLAIMEKLVVVATSHSQQFGKKRSRPSRCAITSYFGATNLYKKFDEAQQQFLENLVLYPCKGYKPFSTYDNIWLRRLVLRLYLRLVFSFLGYVYRKNVAYNGKKNHAITCVVRAC